MSRKATEPTEPTAPTEPAEPTEAAEPTGAMEPMDSDGGSDAGDPACAPERDWRGPRSFPAAFLLAGERARRQCWAPGYELLATEAGGRTGARRKLMITGSRSGLIEWKPQHLADELLAQDWMVIVAEPEPLP